MAHTGSHLAPTSHRWREHWGLDGDESLASQDHAQEVQIWCSLDFDDTNRALSLLDGPIESPFQFLYYQPKTQPATRNFHSQRFLDLNLYQFLIIFFIIVHYDMLFVIHTRQTDDFIREIEIPIYLIQGRNTDQTTILRMGNE